MSTRIRKVDQGMRRSPKQERSRATVDAIIEAGTQVLGLRGWSVFTTNEVADRAGVSIGSLYQYFPNKLALIEAIRQRHFDDVLAVLRKANESANELEQCFALLIRGLLSVHAAHPSLHRALLEEVPRSDGTIAAHADFESRYLDYYVALISRYRKRRNLKRLEIEARTLSAAIEGVVHQMAMNGLTDSSELSEELTRLACGYLKNLDVTRPDDHRH